MDDALRPCPEHRGQGHACTQPAGHPGLHTAAGLSWHVFTSEELAAHATRHMFDPNRPLPPEDGERTV